MSKLSNVAENYVCINCGNSVGELYKEYSPSVLKMSRCDKCHQIADKYIEYDPVIVIIDLVLLNRQAYQHIIYNTTFKNHWKLAIILLLVESYYNWSSLNEGSMKIKNFQDIHYDLFQGEKNFYITFGKTVFGASIIRENFPSFISINVIFLNLTHSSGVIDLQLKGHFTSTIPSPSEINPSGEAARKGRFSSGGQNLVSTSLLVISDRSLLRYSPIRRFNFP
ncbi:hypothetical protein J437_LFUL019357 [Ladona fulva]|uniref:Protein ARV n=1 Tax=Ladona fulva TaxID=123851 RepID=A0A8K0KPP5_LADFU|nr:hypothetical protein J437_LFUL019357 [Ladona fulva]